MFFVQIKNKKKMHDFLWMYATRFEHGKLVSPNNFYSYKKHLEFYLKEWGGLFDKFGSNISIAQGPSKNRSIWDENKNFRLYEFILSLQNKGHITINKCYLEDYGAYGGYDYESGRTFPTIKDTALKLNIKFKKRPLEIGRLENSFSIHYGDLKINERGKIAYYKNHKFCAIQARNNSFKVLCYLASQPDTNISILKIYREFEPKSKVRELSLKKKKVKGWIKEIKEALKITQDKNRTIDISIVGDDVLLTQDTR
ncbi:MAG: hypothetical protein A2270_03030 [Elusimicrobia bacterium RIFOXYA12_FULL_51_18]|nr:MAG: hypothetical protein A2270_03030 [Elusimicrobia bacterium RIFOXYA12_FULL_51_18]OGS28380.1 MAG: hypothetical protein A2218_06860 [Elusimicrobia bacterium RIFOXYA2_FULL_53_38]